MKIEPGPWREVGEVGFGPDGKLLMPDPGHGPGSSLVATSFPASSTTAIAASNTWPSDTPSVSPRPVS